MRPLHLPLETDLIWKASLERFLPQAMALCFPAVNALIDWTLPFEFLDKELQTIAPKRRLGVRYADKLVQVRLKSGGSQWLLVHLEIQAQRDPDFALRMWVYRYRIWDRYQRPVVNLAVLADGDPDWAPGPYRTELAGCVEHFEYPTFKVVSYPEPEKVFERSGNVFALLVAAHQMALRTRKDLAKRVNERFRLVRYLYGKGLEREEMVDLFRLIEMLTVMPSEMELQFQKKLVKFEKSEAMTTETLLAPIELIAMRRGWREGRQQGRQEGLEKGHQEGRQQGRQEGQQEGRQEGQQEGMLVARRAAVEEALEARFGTLPAGAKRKVSSLNNEDDLRGALRLAIRAADLKAFLRELGANGQRY